MSEETKQENDSCLGEGWNWAYTPPDSDRLVQIAWDDGSTSDDTLGFYDSVSSIPPTEEKVWWSKDSCLLGNEAVLAWREIEKEETKQEPDLLALWETAFEAFRVAVVVTHGSAREFGQIDNMYRGFDSIIEYLRAENEGV